MTQLPPGHDPHGPAPVSPGGYDPYAPPVMGAPPGGIPPQPGPGVPPPTAPGSVPPPPGMPGSVPPPSGDPKKRPGTVVAGTIALFALTVGHLAVAATFGIEFVIEGMDIGVWHLVRTVGYHVLSAILVGVAGGLLSGGRGAGRVLGIAMAGACLFAMLRLGWNQIVTMMYGYGELWIPLLLTVTAAGVGTTALVAIGVLAGSRNAEWLWLKRSGA